MDVLCPPDVVVRQHYGTIRCCRGGASISSDFALPKLAGQRRVGGDRSRLPNVAGTYRLSFHEAADRGPFGKRFVVAAEMAARFLDAALHPRPPIRPQEFENAAPGGGRLQFETPVFAGRGHDSGLAPRQAGPLEPIPGTLS